ncbi:MAG TPA: ABC transporter substrate-binding protein [Acidimicrobiales bacterium]
MTRPIRAATAALALVLAAAACGDDGGTTSDAATGTDGGGEQGSFPVEVEAVNGPVTIDERPERIVSLSASHTEMLFAIDAGDQVEAVDEYSTYPEEAPVTDLSGFEPNVEAVASYDPDLVVINYDANDLVAGLDALDIPVIELPAAVNLDETYEQIGVLGEATGHPDEADALVDDMQSEIQALVDRVPERAEPATYYHELDDQLHTATSATFIGSIYALAGLENIADEADDGSGFPQISAELVLDADPDVIFLADESGGVTPETVAARAGWGDLTAVQEGNVVQLDPDIASRWGPRIVDFLRTVVEATADIEPAAAA